MKKVITTILTIFASSALFAQTIPNASFETWANGQPTGWGVAGATQGTASVAPNAGSSYLKLTASATKSGLAITQFAINNRPNSLTGLLQFSPQGGDTFVVIVELTKYNTTTKNSDVVGVGSFAASAAAINWSKFTSAISYNPNVADMPDSCMIIMQTGFHTFHSNTYLNLDLLAFSGNSSINEVENIHSYSVYPNPAKDKITVECSLNQNALVQIDIIDIQGKQIKAQEFFMNKGGNNVSIDLSDVQKGIYFVQMKSEGIIKTQKILVD